MSDLSNEQQTQRVHAALIEALTHFDAVCKRLSIAYWVDGGTLLGTIRHQGPIPWDDDVDLCMLREDLTRLVKSGPELLALGYTLRSRDDDPAIAPAAKVYVNGTHMHDTAAEWHGLPRPQHDGLYIDIFVMDRVSRFRIVRRFERSLAWLVTTRSWARYMARSPQLESTRRRVRWTIAGHVPTFVVGAADQWLKFRARRRDDTLLAVGMAGLFYGLPCPREMIFPLREGTFAGLTVPIPADPHGYLTIEYGSDYMTLPPVDQRISHAEWVSFDDG